MNVISGAGALVSRMRELAGSQPSPSIAEVVGSPDPSGLEGIDASEFTARYEMAILANTFRANADQALALIEMLDPHRSDRG